MVGCEGIHHPGQNEITGVHTKQNLTPRSSQHESPVDVCETNEKVRSTILRTTIGFRDNLRGSKFTPIDGGRIDGRNVLYKQMITHATAKEELRLLLLLRGGRDFPSVQCYTWYTLDAEESWVYAKSYQPHVSLVVGATAGLKHATQGYILINLDHS